MTQYIFMNECIRQKKPERPVIVVQEELTSDGPTQRESNEFELWHHGTKIGRVVFNPKGLAACETHDVKAWVELDDLVTISSTEDRKPPAPVAEEKKPNTPIDFKLKFR